MKSGVAMPSSAGWYIRDLRHDFLGPGDCSQSIWGLVHGKRQVNALFGNKVPDFCTSAKIRD